jgi:hypothetical protein
MKHKRLKIKRKRKEEMLKAENMGFNVAEIT